MGDLRAKRKENGDVSIWDHAKRVYANSSLPKYCWICGYNKHYDVCHIKPVRLFTDDALISNVNSLTNLMAMCRNHHWEFDHNQLSIDDKEKLSKFLVGVIGVEPIDCLL
jgi:predicted restriction endonuclease